MKTLCCIALLLAGSAQARQFSMAIGGGFAAPLSPDGPASFVTEYRSSPGMPEARMLWHKGDWGFGLQGGDQRFQRVHDDGQLKLQSIGLALEWDWPTDGNAEDHLYFSLAGLAGVADVEGPHLSREWTSGAGELSLGYELPLGLGFSVLAESSLVGLLGPTDFDAIAAGAVRLWLRSSF